MKITIVIAGLLLVPFAFTQNAAKDPDVERRQAVAHEVNVILNQRDWTTMTVECLQRLTKPEQGGNAAMVAAQAVMHVATESAV